MNTTVKKPGDVIPGYRDFVAARVWARPEDQNLPAVTVTVARASSLAVLHDPSTNTAIQAVFSATDNLYQLFFAIEQVEDLDRDKLKYGLSACGEILKLCGCHIAINRHYVPQEGVQRRAAVLKIGPSGMASKTIEMLVESFNLTEIPADASCHFPHPDGLRVFPEMSKAQIAKTAICSEDLDLEVLYRDLVYEVGTWSRYNFPGDLPYPERKVLGIAEEFGELLAAVHNFRTSVNEEGRSLYLAEALDAVADIAIYTINLFDAHGDATAAVQALKHGLSVDSSSGDDYIDISHKSPSAFLLTMAARSIGEMSHLALKSAQGIRGKTYDRVAYLMPAIRLLRCAVVMAYGDCSSASASEVNRHIALDLLAVWLKVRARDWRKAPKTGKAPVEPIQ